MTTSINFLVGCQLFQKENPKASFFSRRQILTDALISQVDHAVSFNGRHFEVDLSFLKGLPENVLYIIQEKVRQTNLFIEDALDIKDRNVLIETPDGELRPLWMNQTSPAHPEYNAHISWHHIRIMLNPDIIKKGLRSGWTIAGLLLTQQTIKVACFRSKTNLRFVNHNIWFDYDLLSKQVCCDSGIELDGDSY